VAIILTNFLRINCSNFIGLVWRRHTKFQIGMAAALPDIPLPAPLPTAYGLTIHKFLQGEP